MSLFDLLFKEQNKEPQELYEEYGVVSNPFPAFNQTRHHPHMTTAVDEKIMRLLRSFLRDGKTQVLVMEGTQGLGKTNVLENYATLLEESREYLSGFVIVRYTPDPEPDFGKVVQRIVQEFGEARIREIGEQLANKPNDERIKLLNNVSNPDVRSAFSALANAKNDEVAQLCFEYLLGHRVLKKHIEGLGVMLRLDTTESRTQALRDLVYLSVDLGILQAVCLFMDEVEKIGGLLSASMVTKYLSSLRALIDALPNHMFLFMGMTPDARLRYIEMLPALAGRLQNTEKLLPLRETEDAIKLARFYMTYARERARGDVRTQGLTQGTQDVIPEHQMHKIFEEMQTINGVRTNRPVTQRAFLGTLANAVNAIFYPENTTEQEAETLRV